MQALLMIFTVLALAVVAKISGLADEDRSCTASVVMTTSFDLSQSGAGNIVVARDQ
jgi:hypothetical protein